MKKMDEAQLLELPKTMLIDLLTQMHVPTAKIEEASSDKYKERDGKPDKGPLVKLVIRYNGGHPEIHQIRTLLTPPVPLRPPHLLRHYRDHLYRLHHPSRPHHR